MIKNQKGFSGLEVILMIALTGVIVGVGVYVFTQRTNSSSKEVKQSNDSSQSKDAYKGWSTYSSDKSNISFKYPSSWTMAEEDGFEGGKEVTLTGPNGLKLAYVDSLGGLGGGCDPETPHIIVTNAKPLKSAKGVYLVENPGTLALSDNINKTGDQGSCLVYPTIGPISFSTSIQFKGNNESFTEKQKADLDEAKLVLSSFTK